MKVKMHIIVLVLLCLTNASVYGNENFYIEGTCLGLNDGTPIYLLNYPKKDTVANAYVQKGKFSLSGRVEEGTSYFYLRVDSSIIKTPSNSFLLVNKSLKMKLDFKTWPKLSLKGSDPNDELEELKILWEANKDSKNLKERLSIYIKNHKNSVYVSDLINKLEKIYTLEEREEMYRSLNKKAMDSYFGKLLKRNLHLERLRLGIKKGVVLPDLSLMNLENRKESILEIAAKSEYTLIDFWASWCKPCRKEMPNLKRAFDEFHDRGFNILSVALSDKLVDWKKAILEDNTNWTHVRDIENESYKLFDVAAIPAFMLIDNKGRIVAFSCDGSTIKSFGPELRGAALFETINVLLPKMKKMDISESQVSGIAPLKVGDLVPNITLKLTGTSDTVLKLNDLRGKLVILDFWSVYCAVCVSQFEHMKNLQDKFGDKIVILPVGFDGYKNGSVVKFLNKSKGTFQELKLATAIQNVGDTILERLFPFGDLPHEVWISQTGELIGITDHRAVTEKNILKILNGNTLAFGDKIVKRKYLELNEELILSRHNDRIQFASGFSGSIDSFTCISTKLNPDDSTKYYRWYWINATMFDLYKDLYYDYLPELKSDSKNRRIIFENFGDQEIPLDWASSKKLDNWEYNKFVSKNLFCYEMICSSKMGKEDVKEKVLRDLNNFFGIESYIDEKVVECLEICEQQINREKVVNDSFSLHPDFKEGNIDDIYYWLMGAMNTNMPILVSKELNMKKECGLINKFAYTQSDIDWILQENNLALRKVNKKMKVLMFKKRK